MTFLVIFIFCQYYAQFLAFVTSMLTYFTKHFPTAKYSRNTGLYLSLSLKIFFHTLYIPCPISMFTLKVILRHCQPNLSLKIFSHKSDLGLHLQPNNPSVLPVQCWYLHADSSISFGSSSPIQLTCLYSIRKDHTLP